MSRIKKAMTFQAKALDIMVNMAGGILRAHMTAVAEICLIFS